MLARWCISVLILGLTLFGVVSQQQFMLPNQEIVLQFEDVNLNVHQTENTVTRVKQQLQRLGAENIQVLELENGTLKITYFSDADIASIRAKFSEENDLALQLTSHSKNSESSNLPVKDSNVSYNLDIFEIHKSQDSGWDFDGVISLEFKSKSNRFLDPNPLSVAWVTLQHEVNLIQVAYKIRKNVAFKISDALHTIPEVRAGPIG
jgi:regulator of replication initiation timing